jgi:SAM-dependent methyltransferase
VSFTYSSVDRGTDPAGAADWQDRIDAWPAIRAYKDHMARFLPDDGLVLDVGCGTGGDLVAIGVDRAIGLDPSDVMCRRVVNRGALVCRGDGEALPFASGSFRSTRTDRVLQHLSDPLAALRELGRVTEPGGSIVLADPDQESLTIHVDGVPPVVTDRVKALRRDIGYRNGRLASRLPALMAELGLVDVQVAAFPLVLTVPADAFGIATWPRNWRERGVARFEDDELEQWEHAIAAGRGFVYAVMYFVVSARRVG